MSGTGGELELKNQYEPQSWQEAAGSGQLLSYMWTNRPGMNDLVPGYRDDEGTGMKALDYMSIPTQLTTELLIQGGTVLNPQTVVIPGRPIYVKGPEGTFRRLDPVDHDPWGEAPEVPHAEYNPPGQGAFGAAIPQDRMFDVEPRLVESPTGDERQNKIESNDRLEFQARHDKAGRLMDKTHELLPQFMHELNTNFDGPRYKELKQQMDELHTEIDALHEINQNTRIARTAKTIIQERENVPGAVEAMMRGVEERQRLGREVPSETRDLNF